MGYIFDKSLLILAHITIFFFHFSIVGAGYSPVQLATPCIKQDKAAEITQGSSGANV